MITVRRILLVSLVPLVGWGLGFGLKSRFTHKKPPQKIDSLTDSERDALVANFSSQTGLPMHRMLAQTLPTTDLKLIRRLAEELAKRDQNTIQSVVWNALFSRWVALAPRPAVEFGRGNNLAYFAMKAWAQSDVERAIASAEAIHPAETQAILEVLLEVDPQRGADLYADYAKTNQKPCGKNEQLHSELLRKSAQRNPESPLVFGEKSATQRALSEAAKGTLQPSLVVEGIENGAFPTLDEAMISLRHHFPRENDLGVQLAKVAALLANKNPIHAADLMDAMEWKDWVSLEASRAVVRLPDAPLKNDIEPSINRGLPSINDCMATVLKSLVETDPKRTTISYAKTKNSPPSLRLKLLKSFLPLWFIQDPASALEWLSSTGCEGMSLPQMQSLVREFDANSEQLREFAERVPPGIIQQAMARQWVLRQNLEDPALTYDRISFADPTTRQAALDQLVVLWGETQPQAALERILKEPAPPPETIQAVVANWAQRDRQAAKEWAQKLPEGMNKDAAICGLVDALTKPIGELDCDFPAALSLALGMNAAEKRKIEAQRILSLWPNHDEDAVMLRKVITSSALAEAEQQHFLQQLQP